MNINYDKIITTANERAERLKALAIKLEELPAMAQDLIDSLVYFERLGADVDLMDAEGQALLPNGIASRIKAVAAKANDALSTFARHNNSLGANTCHVTALVEAVNKSKE